MARQIQSTPRQNTPPEPQPGSIEVHADRAVEPIDVGERRPCRSTRAEIALAAIRSRLGHVKGRRAGAPRSVRGLSGTANATASAAVLLDRVAGRSGPVIRAGCNAVEGRSRGENVVVELGVAGRGDTGECD